MIIETILFLKFDIYNKKLDLKKINLLLKGLTEFKEHLGGKLTIMLLSSIGKGITVNDLNVKKLKQTTQLLKKMQKISTTK